MSFYRCDECRCDTNNIEINRGKQLCSTCIEYIHPKLRDLWAINSSYMINFYRNRLIEKYGEDENLGSHIKAKQLIDKFKKDI